MKVNFENPYEVGDIITSSAGRDAGRPFIVMWIDGIFVGLCDGDLRKTDKIKRKKIKHIKTTNINSSFIRDKIARGEKVTNAEIRRAIEEEYGG